MHATFALGTVTLALLLGATGSAPGRHQVQVSIDKDGAQVGASRNPRQRGYEHACRDGADRGRFDREHGFRYNRDGRIDRRPDEPRNQWQRTTDPYATCEWGATDTAFDIGDRDGLPSDQNERGRNLRVLISTRPTPGGIPDSQAR